MKEIDLVFVDTNIPMYAAGVPHEYRDSCREILRQVVGGKLHAITNVEVHQELIHRYLSLGLGDKAREVSQDFEVVVPNILDISIGDLRLARALSEKYGGMPARDLVHVAVMVNHGVRFVASADRHFDNISEVERIDPRILVG